MNNQEINNQLIRILKEVKWRRKTVKEGHEAINELLGLNKPEFKIYEIGSKVKWFGSNADFYVIEDNCDYNVLIGTHRNTNHPDYNDWWVDKKFINISVDFFDFLPPSRIKEEKEKNVLYVGLIIDAPTEYKYLLVNDNYNRYCVIKQL